RSANYYGGTKDNGGVHTNSGVGNKAAFLITDGGTFNGQTITGIGATKALHLYYQADQMLTSGGDYADLAAILPHACDGLVTTGTAGMVAGDCTNVRKAVTATQMALDPTAGSTTPAPVCPTGATKSTVFRDGFEADRPMWGSVNWFNTSSAAPGWGFV